MMWEEPDGEHPKLALRQTADGTRGDRGVARYGIRARRDLDWYRAGFTGRRASWGYGHRDSSGVGQYRHGRHRRAWSISASRAGWQLQDHGGARGLYHREQDRGTSGGADHRHEFPVVGGGRAGDDHGLPRGAPRRYHPALHGRHDQPAANAPHAPASPAPDA